MRCSLLLPLLLLVVAVDSQAASLIFTNVGAELELDEDMPVRFRPNEIIVTCAGDCRPKPRIEEFAFASSAVGPGAGNARLSWHAPAAEVCFGEAPAGIAGWSGIPIENTGELNLTVPVRATPYSFTIRCFATYGSNTATATVTVQ